MNSYLKIIVVILAFCSMESEQCKKKSSLDNTQLSKEALDYILKNTGANRDDVNDYYNGFLKDFPTGTISKKEFKKLMEGYNQVTDDRMDDFIKHSFHVYDTNNDGIIEFKEFYIKIWVESFGSLEQKTELAFKLFDTNRDNYIEKSDIKKVLTSLSKANKPFGKTRGKEYKERMANIEYNSERIFELSDKNKDKKISYEEFKDAVMTNEFVRSRTVNALF